MYNWTFKIGDITSHRRVLESLLDLADPDFSPVICQFPPLPDISQSQIIIVISSKQQWFINANIYDCCSRNLDVFYCAVESAWFRSCVCTITFIIRILNPSVSNLNRLPSRWFQIFWVKISVKYCVCQIGSWICVRVKHLLHKGYMFSVYPNICLIELVVFKY